MARKLGTQLACGSVVIDKETELVCEQRDGDDTNVTRQKEASRCEATSTLCNVGCIVMRCHSKIDSGTTVSG